MKAKTARRILSRAAWRIARSKFFDEATSYYIKKAFKRELRALRLDQSNPASRRVYQRSLYLLS